ncbi:hypothetical protein D9M69_529770 [compost metagenome]
MRGFQEVRAQRRVPRHGGLGGVQRLCTDFADMIHAHQRTGLAALRFAQFTLRLDRGRKRPGGVRSGKKRTQSRIGGSQGWVEQGGHAPI